jgi:hypothetical protein
MTSGLVARCAVAAATAGLLYGLSWLSAAPVRQLRSPVSRLRLSWTARPERIEVCRTLSAAEQEEREEHMRQRVECDGHFATYALRVDVDGGLVHERVVRGAGLRHDRPLYLLREIDLSPGVHRLHVTFTRRERTDNDAAAFARAATTGIDTGLFAGRAEREAAEHARRARAAIPPRLELDTVVTFLAEHVLLVSLDAERRTLFVVSEAPK